MVLPGKLEAIQPVQAADPSPQLDIASLQNLTIDQVTDLMSAEGHEQREIAARAEAPQVDDSDSVLAAVQQLMTGQQPELAEPVQQPEIQPPATTPVQAPQQAQPDAMQLMLQQLMQQNAMLQQAMFQPPPAPPAPREPTDQEIAQQMERIGLNPMSELDIFTFQQSMETHRANQAAAARIANIENMLQQWQASAAQLQAQSAIEPQIQAAVKQYGVEAPAATVKHIVEAATQAVLQGHQTSHAIQAALEPFVPMFQALKSQAAARPPVRNQAGVRAAALSAKTTGHKPQTQKVAIEDLERLLFRQN